MKRLNTSNITTGASLPLKSGSLDFIQDSYKELLSVLIESAYDMIPAPPGYCSYVQIDNYHYLSYDTTIQYIYTNGELFIVDKINVGSGSYNWFEIVNNQYTGNGINADSVEFTDGIQRNVHNIRKIIIHQNTTNPIDPSGFGIVDSRYLTTVQSGSNLIDLYDIRMFTCDQQYIDDNFHSFSNNGYTTYYANVGTDLYGWNFKHTAPVVDTYNYIGKTLVGYDPVNYPTIGATGGSKDAVLVEHNHDVNMYLGAGLLAGGGGVGLLGQNINSSTTNAGVGEDGIGKNMQPYKVILYLERL